VPRVTVHYAQSLDGRLATRTGDSQWIGGQASLELAHQLRAEHAAVLVGIGTVLADNPRLTVRLVPGASPRRVVLDSTLRTPLDAHLVTDGSAPTTLVTTDRAPAERVDALRQRGVDVRVQRGSERVDLRTALDQLGCDSVLIEGGGAVITSALRERLVQRMVVCIAACVIGHGTDAVGDLGVERLSEALSFTSARFAVLDHDVIFDGAL
jgi:riboflavin-specific deaminase-like protein